MARRVRRRDDGHRRPVCVITMEEQGRWRTPDYRSSGKRPPTRHPPDQRRSPSRKFGYRKDARVEWIRPGAPNAVGSAAVVNINVTWSMDHGPCDMDHVTFEILKPTPWTSRTAIILA